MPVTVLATGGAGYVGSHVVVALLAAGRRVVILDDFSNADPEAVERIAAIGAGVPEVVRGDVRDPARLDDAFGRFPIDAVVHLAGLKAVGESVAEPLRYYTTNVAGTASLLRAMDATDVRRLVFSSSCTVYGDPERVPATLVV